MGFVVGRFACDLGCGAAATRMLKQQTAAVLQGGPLQSSFKGYKAFTAFIPLVLLHKSNCMFPEDDMLGIDVGLLDETPSSMLVSKGSAKRGSCEGSCASQTSH